MDRGVGNRLERLWGRGIAEAAELDGGGFTINYEVLIAAPPERVFAGLTDEVHQWWPHTITERPHLVAVEKFIGGRFYEQFDADGRGALYAIVEIYHPPSLLRFRGSIAMDLAVQVVFTLRLEAHEGGTRLTEETHVAGETSAQLREGMTRGTEEEYGVHLRAWLEQGIAIR
jgi:uncharacterized protein YndB with AHSA1/START domain